MPLGIKLGNVLIEFAFFHYTDMLLFSIWQLLFGEAASIAFDETALKDLGFFCGESHTEFQTGKQGSK